MQVWKNPTAERGFAQTGGSSVKEFLDTLNAERARSGTVALSGARLPDMAVFEDVAVVPNTMSAKGIYDGGPIWPDFASQDVVRHCRDGIPVDVKPHVPEGDFRRLSGSYVYGGMARVQFGHLLCEYTTRILISLAHMPDARFLMTTEPGMTAESLPAHVWECLELLGLSRDRVTLIDKPVRVERLHVAPQGEQMKSIGPGQAYLDLVKANAQRILTNTASPEGLLFVCRKGLAAAGNGAHAGEAHLADCLTRLGAKVLDPVSVPVRAQLEDYTNAKTIVFAEGSAVHGLQLLAGLSQDVVVLNRRRGNRIALPQLLPRCGSLRYAEACASEISPIRKKRGANTVVALGFYDIPVLFETFDALGVPLASVWDQGAYREAQEIDVRAWMSVRFQDLSNINVVKTQNTMRAVLKSEGLTHIDVSII